MLPIERQNRIKALILNKRNIKISELSQTLQVSEMTIHRDLKPLIETGMIIKTFGGISLNSSEAGKLDDTQTCVFCSSGVDERQAYRLILSNNQIEVACCAHCGLLRQRQLGDDVTQAICHDFLKQTTISAPDAWYVMDTSIHMGCCQPQVLTFQFKEHAVKFVKGFGGNVYPFQEAIEVLDQKMNPNHPHCCQADKKGR
ncbi:DeoR/GlpR family transcriptional regulator of sugar metabolism [Virgibacillus halotolerans]|uniref:DeoR family transcriptional regulator n=1 Tax=Virgibacillus halotolerans TaxID=1071053 RepID=UPI0019607288|nr:DeoR family transcriptional regulator [Virgibacillus halotolerans]MBM7600591.1 DeoR/GlpR family transcriptional regulator of sugar metabolism [Virgibacillus halotolerans]